MIDTTPRFWTLQGDSERLTLCEHHALEATNAAMTTSGGDAFGSMSEAAVVLAALLATVGDDIDFTTDPMGPCGECVAYQRGVA